MDLEFEITPKNAVSAGILIGSSISASVYSANHESRALPLEYIVTSSAHVIVNTTFISAAAFAVVRGIKYLA